MRPWISVDRWKGLQLLWIGALSVLPDIDFVPGFLTGNPNRFHHGITHSIAFCLAASGILALLPRAAKQGIGLPEGRVILAVLATHLVLDFFTRDQAPPIGMPIFWPVAGGGFASPIILFPDIVKASRSEVFIKSLFNVHNLRAVMVESAVLGPLTVLAFLGSRRRREAADRPS